MFRLGRDRRKNREDYENDYDYFEGEEDYYDEEDYENYEDYREYGYYEEQIAEDNDNCYEQYGDDDCWEEEDEWDSYDEEEYIFQRRKRNIFEKIVTNIRAVSASGVLVACSGIAIIVMGILVGQKVTVQKTTTAAIQNFAEVGATIEKVEIIGQSGLIAVLDNSRAVGITELTEEETVEQVEEAKESDVTVKMHVTTIQSDLKIKFVNAETDKLISGLPFKAGVIDVKGNSTTYTDDDRDGVIYKTKIPAGTYTVKLVALGEYEGYRFTDATEKVIVKDTIEYKKVDVADEVKTEAQINVAVEDTAVMDTAIESVLKDTVEWVESSKKAKSTSEDYEEVSKSKIAEPTATAFANIDGSERVYHFYQLTEVSGNSSAEEGKNPPESSGSQEGEQTSGEPKPETPKKEETPKNTVTKVSIDQSTVTLKIGGTETVTLKATVTTEGSPDTSLTWKSSDPAVATVASSGSEATITAKAVGKTTISVISNADNNLTASCSVIVEAAEVKPAVTLSASSQTVNVNASVTITATVKPDTVKDRTVTWISSDTAIAKVENGKITGVKAGTATITATTKAEPVASATCKVTVVVDPKNNTTSVLKDKDGNVLYVKESDKYRQAVFADYFKASKFYKKVETVSEYIYTGWQTIDDKTYFFDKDGNKVTGEQVIQGAKYSFNSDGSLNSGSGVMGIDVSKWNGNIDWNAVKNSGVSYVIIRCGYRGAQQGSLVQDSKYAANIAGATKAGLKVGVYFFTQAVNQVEAVEEASMVLNLVKGQKISYPIFLDVEAASGGRANGLDAGTRTEVIKAFCATIQNSGYTAGVYANKTWLAQKMNVGSLGGYKIWLAQYAATPTYSGKYNMWQYSSKGAVSGISGNVDMNISYLGY